MNYPFRMCLGEAFFLSRWLLFCHNCFAEVPLGRRNAASHRYVYTNIAHRHFRPGQRAQHHQIIEIAQMPEAEQFARWRPRFGNDCRRVTVILYGLR